MDRPEEIIAIMGAVAIAAALVWFLSGEEFADITATQDDAPVIAPVNPAQGKPATLWATTPPINFNQVKYYDYGYQKPAYAKE